MSTAPVGSSRIRSGRRATATAAPEPAPAPVKQQARQLVVTEGPLKGTTLPLAASPILLGRAQEATLVLEDDYASGRHARLFPQGSRWFIEDLGSSNGTWSKPSTAGANPLRCFSWPPAAMVASAANAKYTSPRFV